MDGEFKPTKEWAIVPRVSRIVPFGYRPDPEDPDLLLPNVLELEALERAKKHIKRGYSYRETATWLGEVTGRTITHTGLKKRIENDRSRVNRLEALKLAAKRIEEQIRKTEKANDLREASRREGNKPDSDLNGDALDAGDNFGTYTED